MTQEAGTLRQRTKTVVVIEDDPDVLEAIHLLLTASDYDCIAAINIQEALMSLRERGQSPDAILADYRLGGQETGSDAIRRLRLEFGKSIPGILLTGDTSPDRLQEAKSSGLDLLHKPISSKVLMGVIERVLQGRE